MLFKQIQDYKHILYSRKNFIHHHINLQYCVIVEMQRYHPFKLFFKIVNVKILFRFCYKYATLNIKQTLNIIHESSFLQRFVFLKKVLFRFVKYK